MAIAGLSDYVWSLEEIVQRMKWLLVSFVNIAEELEGNCPSSTSPMPTPHPERTGGALMDQQAAVAVARLDKGAQREVVDNRPESEQGREGS
jgi:hypothetical protein